MAGQERGRDLADCEPDRRRSDPAMSTDLAVVNGQVVVPGGTQRSSLVIEHGRITTIGEVPADWTGPILDAQQKLVAPGLIDLQLNGGFGADFTSTSSSIWSVAE